MTVEPLLTQLAFTQFAIAKNTAGVTQAESLRRAVDDGSHMNWVMGHIINGRSGMLRAARRGAGLERRRGGAVPPRCGAAPRLTGTATSRRSSGCSRVRRTA